MAAPQPVKTPGHTDDWWRGAAIYQVYPRSFADGDGDGTGDLAGVRSRLPYLAELGVDAIWFTPGTCPRSPTGATTSPTIAPSTPPSVTSARPSG